jgi:hypothetical protein
LRSLIPRGLPRGHSLAERYHGLRGVIFIDRACSYIDPERAADFWLEETG